jgi:hypothetical protein
VVVGEAVVTVTGTVVVGTGVVVVAFPSFVGTFASFVGIDDEVGLPVDEWVVTNAVTPRITAPTIPMMATIIQPVKRGPAGTGVGGMGSENVIVVQSLP